MNNQAQTFFSQAIAKFNSEDYIGAMENLTQAIELNPTLMLAYYYRGLSYNKINKVGRYQDFFKAVELDPNLVDAHCYVAKYYLDDYEFENAVKALNKALSIDPNHILALSTMGDAYNMFAKYDKAREFYDKVIVLDPNNFWAYFNRAHSKGGNNDFKGAFDDFSSAIGINPSFYNTYYHRANIRHSMGDIEGAIADMTRSIELEPDYYTALYLRAFLKADNSDFTGALNDINATIALGRGADNHMYFIDRGIINLLQDQYSDAITDFNSVIKLNRKLPLTRLYRGIAKYYLGNKVGARSDWKREGVSTETAKSVMNNLKKIPFRFLINLRFNEESKESDFHYSNIKKQIDGDS